MFDRLKDRLSGVEEEAEEAVEEAADEGSDEAATKTLTIPESKLDDLLFDLEIGLYEADVAEPVVQDILDNARERLAGAEVPSKGDVGETIRQALEASIVSVMEADDLDFDMTIATADKPFVVMFVGVNGTGKTTTIGRVAHRLKSEGYSCVLAAGDTYRAGAIEQLHKHGDNLGVKTISHEAGGDAAAVAYDAVEHARARSKDVVLIDTAGRMQTDINLMEEMKKIDRVAEPDMTVFVGDALAGNDAIDQALKFDEAIGIDGVVLCKIDSDAKGGAALSIAHTVGKPILFLGVGQDYDDLIPFRAGWMAERLFGP